MKYIEVHNETYRVMRVEDALPSNPAEAAHFIECPDDNVEENWWLDPATETLYEFKKWEDVNEVRSLRNEKLNNTDWMLGPDSPYKDDATFQADIRTYRQALRDITKQEALTDDTWPQMDGISSGRVP
jgi:hypothetical protein